ncbi:zinc finger protein 862-like [Saccoglossus kowalevskii]|uniref:Zinc finger protein 862-like n=1 Tax=Saccoglossus kowalevskii TaxID=10224 RepID=A0ABM0MCX5_SACKO|nr:PREDICTED: zinc finger protein 862-like [Saccoglossus kowalevskii]
MANKQITNFFRPVEQNEIPTTNTGTSDPTSSHLATKRKIAWDSILGTSTRSKSRKPKQDGKIVRWIEQFEWLDVDTSEGGRQLEAGNIYRVWCKWCRSTREKTDYASERGKLVEKKESLTEHSASSRHIHARDKFFAGPVETSSLAKAFRKSADHSVDKTVAELKIKFNIAYMIAKHEMPYSMFPKLLLLHRKNGVDINPTYDNTHKCAEIIANIADGMRRELSSSIKNANYISILIDGDTDNAAKECEIVYVRRVDKNGKATVNLLGQNVVEHALADGVLSATKALCEYVDERWSTKLIGFCADGAAVNLGRNRSVSTLLRDGVANYLVSIHCMPHRLELAMLAVQKNVAMVRNVHDVLNMIWKTYHYSPKSYRELGSLAMELGVNVYTPKSVTGTRWAPHVERALRIFLSTKQVDKNNPTSAGQYAAVLAHSEHLASTTRNADIKGRATKVVRTMTTLKFAAFCHFLLDLFSEIATLSHTLQTNDVILTQAIQAVKSCIATVELMKMQPVENGSLEKFKEIMNTEQINSNNASTDDNLEPVTFQEIKLKGRPT